MPSSFARDKVAPIGNLFIISAGYGVYRIRLFSSARHKLQQLVTGCPGRVAPTKPGFLAVQVRIWGLPFVLSQGCVDRTH